ncbi:hypothetical protein TSOC_009659 [Tetrabaena socialis]|uniref:mTERF domain-containing protein 1, mitochondrial n=1 Tax=Tetrabaena socialis TaxID=47790 RepID=A0A2J7ZV96_9CHLO|nr:hypothetical protein TSOC_009659 [Tetrabaena socialis]|eukprot:PNH04207.1 hypothetical protein TSOC_009659 [Tetrabaena socialis]
MTARFVPAKQRWCPSLERDVHAVCGEAGLSRAVTDSIVAAAAAGIISQNPGVLLSRLLSFLSCLTEPLGRRNTLAVLRAAPSLLRYSPESLRWNAEMMASLLPDGTVGEVVARAPMLLPASAITLWGNFENLRRLLGLNRAAALQLAVRCPRLLHNTRGALAGRLEQLALLAGQPLERVAAAVARQPTLLSYFPGTLERNLRNAAAQLGVPFSRVQRLLTKQPALAMLAPDTLTQRVQRLRQTAGLADPADLASVVLRQPSLLTLLPETVLAKVGVVERVLGLGGRPDALRAVLRGAPQLLTLSSSTIASKAEQLREAVAPCAALRDQLAHAPPLSVAVWLCLSSLRYKHVRAAAEAEAKAEAGVVVLEEESVMPDTAGIHEAGAAAVRRQPGAEARPAAQCAQAGGEEGSGGSEQQEQQQGEGVPPGSGLEGPKKEPACRGRPAQRLSLYALLKVATPGTGIKRRAAVQPEPPTGARGRRASRIGG